MKVLDKCAYVVGMLCPECHRVLKCEGRYEYLELWLGAINWASCEPCQRFFYLLQDQNQQPLTVIDAGPGMGPGDEGYSFDPNVNGLADSEDYDYYMALEANRPKCDICGVRHPSKGCKRCQKCADRWPS